VNGTGCPNGTRNLLEYFFPDTYPDDLHVDPNTTVTRPWFLKQSAARAFWARSSLFKSLRM
jgi:hypothetical protein